MSAIGRLAASLVSGTNENTFALANFNLDFSLIKVEAPIEYQGLRSALSKRRVEDAEQGQSHRTARRLGALFEQILPPIKKLAEVYGKRVSEIVASEKLSKKGSAKDGPFASVVGFDGTSIYAAATSGQSAIAVHLLACMLARTWSGPEAISIWVELVASRKKDIQENQDASQIQGMAAMVAAQQDISRDDLAKWDSSARAWLLCADEVQKVKMTQLRLTTRDCGLHVSSIGNTYTGVIEVWTIAMKTVQDLILGMPQRISKGAVLVGLSAWHIYPDLNIVGPTAHVKFNDELVVAGGVITIGLQSVSREEHTGVQWSLSLSHLRYYGDPVSICAKAGDASLRITMQDLHYVALGSLFAAWVPYVIDNTSGCEFLLALRDAVKVFKELDFDWLQLLWDASQQFLNLSKPLEKEDASSLIALGRRKGHILFGWQEQSPIPLLGLNSPMIWDWFSWKTPPHGDDMFEYTMCCIELFRAMAQRHNLASHQYLIRYRAFHGRPTHRGHLSDGAGYYPVKESYNYTTVRPIDNPSLKRDRHHKLRVDHKHCHWLSLSYEQSSFDEKLKKLDKHQEDFDAKVDICFPKGVHDGCRFEWNQPPKAFRSNIVIVDDEQGLPTQLTYGSHQQTSKDSLKFIHVAGNPQEIALFRVLEKRREDFSEQALINGTQATSFLRSGKATTKSLVEYLQSHQHAEAALQVTESILCLAQATALYDQLPGATVSVSVLNLSLREAKWRKWYDDRSRSFNELDRHAKFACIAMFESGNLNLDPGTIGSVIAMSSGNSIFTLTAILQDPSIRKRPLGEVTRILGNLNRPGVVILVPPPEPLLRKCDPGAWRVVAHKPFDGKSNDAFAHTSLHLSFTQYEMPLIIRTGTMDAEVTVLESLVSVYDREKWTGDIDIVSQPFRDSCHPLACSHEQRNKTSSSEHIIKRIGTIYCRQLISIDSWDELLDPPENLGSHNIGVFRAVGNWQAKVAALAICIRLGYRTFLKPANSCDACFLQIQRLKDMQIYIL